MVSFSGIYSLLDFKCSFPFSLQILTIAGAIHLIHCNPVCLSLKIKTLKCQAVHFSVQYFVLYTIIYYYILLLTIIITTFLAALTGWITCTSLYHFRFKVHTCDKRPISYLVYFTFSVAF